MMGKRALPGGQDLGIGNGSDLVWAGDVSLDDPFAQQVDVAEDAGVFAVGGDVAREEEAAGGQTVKGTRVDEAGFNELQVDAAGLIDGA